MSAFVGHHDIQAQDITLQRGKQTRVFKAGTYIELLLTSPKEKDCDVCRTNYAAGQLVSYDGGELRLMIQRGGKVIMENGKIIRYDFSDYIREYPHNPVTIPAGDVMAIIPRGKRKLKHATTGESIGTALAVLGVGHLVSAPLGDDKGILLLGLGLGEFLTGGIIVTAFKQKTYGLHPDYLSAAKVAEPLWEFR